MMTDRMVLHGGDIRCGWHNGDARGVRLVPERPVRRRVPMLFRQFEFGMVRLTTRSGFRRGVCPRRRGRDNSG